MRTLAWSGAFCTLLASAGAAAAATIDLGAAPAGATPFPLPAGGVTARFSASADQGGDPAAFAVVPTRFATLGDRVLQNVGFAPAALTITFSAPVLDFSAGFATDDAGPATPLLLTAYRGAAVVGEASAAGTAPVGFFFPEGVIAFSGPLFDRVVLASGASAFAVGTLQATGPRTSGSLLVPEPGTLACSGPARLC